jgi:hypothetical protein
MAILLTDRDKIPRQREPGAVRATPPSEAADLIDQLRERRLTLTYDPQHRTLRTNTQDPVAIAIGR